MDEVAAYVCKVQQTLAFDPIVAKRAGYEIADHLYESAEHLGEAEAVARFGDGALIAFLFAERSAHRAVRFLSASSLFGTVAVFAVMEIRTSFLAMHGISIFRADAPYFSIDAAAFVVAVFAMFLALFISQAGHVRTTIALFTLSACALSLSIVADLVATGAHVAAHGSFVFPTVVAAVCEALADIVVVTATSRLVPRAARAAALLTAGI